MFPSITFYFKEVDGKKWLATDKLNILLVGDKANTLPGVQKPGYEIVELDTHENKN